MVAVRAQKSQSSLEELMRAEAEWQGVSWESYQRMLKAEGQLRREEMLRNEPALQRRRQIALEMGPPGVEATSDDVADVRAMLAKASFQSGSWEDLPGITLVWKGKLAELIVAWCPDHTDYEECTLGCRARFQPRPLKSGAAVMDYLTRRGIDRFEMTEWSWQPVPFESTAAFTAAVQADYWPGVHVMFGDQTVPFMHMDGWHQTDPGIEKAGGWLGVVPGASLTDYGQLPTGRQALAAGRPVLESGLAGKIAALAANGPWTGSKAELADAVEWTGTIMSLNAELGRIRPELAALNLEIIKTGRWTKDKRSEWIITTSESLSSLTRLELEP